METIISFLDILSEEQFERVRALAKEKFGVGDEGSRLIDKFIAEVRDTH